MENRGAGGSGVFVLAFGCDPDAVQGVDLTGGTHLGSAPRLVLTNS